MTKVKSEKKQEIEPKKSKKENPENGNVILLFVSLIVVLIGVFVLPNFNNIFWHIKEVENVEENNDEKIPTTYSCSYGPRYNELYKYTLTGDFVFTFNKNGNLESIVSSETYQALSPIDYKLVKETVTIDAEIQSITYDEENSVLIVKTNTSNVNKLPYPTDFDGLKRYLSQSGYICSAK